MHSTSQPRATALLLALLLALASGCVAVERETTSPDGTGVEEPVAEEPQGSEGGEDGEDLEVPLVVAQGPGGSTLAFVPVTIRGQGPFSFALDTGASNSVIDTRLADELGLEETASPEEVTGATGTGEALQLAIDDWQMGEVDLGARTAGGIELPAAEDGGFSGLLGSDVLSEYGSILVDYDNEVLVLRPRAETIEALD